MLYYLKFQCSIELLINKGDWESIDNCRNNVEGEKLLHEVGVKQREEADQLNFVPWVIINDVSNQLFFLLCRII